MALSIKLSDNSLDRDQCLNFLQKTGNDSQFICRGNLSNSSNREKIIDLDFKEFGPSTLKKLHEIADASCRRFRLSNAVIHHRIGNVSPNDSITVMAFSSDDPVNAYQAFQYALQKLQSYFPSLKNERLEVNRFGERAEA